MVEAKIKIIFVITSTGVGGAEKMLYHTITGLDPARYSIRLCSLKEKGVYARTLEKRGIPVYCLGMREGTTAAGWIDSLRVLLLLFIYFIKERPTIVHSFLFRANITARITAWLSGVPVCISSVRVMGGEAQYCHFIERLTAFMVDRYTAVSEQVKNHIVAQAGVPENKISTIYNGVPSEGSSASAEPPFMNFPGLHPGDRVVMTAGRLHRQKGYDCLIKAIAQLQRSFPSVKLIILGEGEEENNLKKLADLLDLTGKVIFAGLCPDPGTLLQTAELFVLASRWEGMPNVILEAMAAGKAVVATEVGGIPAIVVRGVTGVLVPPEDVHALSHAMKELLEDEGRAQAMGAAGRERVGQHFSIAAMVNKTENLYQELLKRKQLA